MTRTQGLKSAFYLYLSDLMFSQRCKHEKAMHLYDWPFHAIDR
jgi:hypothetical protein